MSKSVIVTGIDVGTHTTRVVVCDISESEKTPRIVATGESPSYGIRHGYIINKHDATKSVRNAIKAAEQEAGIRIRDAFLSLGGVGLNSTTVSATIQLPENAPEVTEYEINRAMEQCERTFINHTKNIKIIESIPLRYALDNKVVLGKPIGMEGSSLGVQTLFVTYLENHLEDLLTTVGDAGIRVTDVVPAPLAAAFTLLTPKQKMVGSALMDIGAETVSLAVFDQGTLLSLKVFQIGSTHITNDIALGFQIPLEEAERAKHGTLDRNSRILIKVKLDEIIQARLSDIFELVDKYLESLEKSKVLPAGIVITGGGAQLAGLTDYAKELLELPIRIIAENDASSKQRKLRDSSWYVAYGLCTYAHESSHHSKGGGSPLSSLWKRIGNFFEQLFP
ncbi:MAG: cell division protein FtsA [Planctomycetota bacterium]|jgi:cell division protein FtsA